MNFLVWFLGLYVHVLYAKSPDTPLVTNGFSHPYRLDGFALISRGIRGIFSFLFHFSMNFLSANRIAPDGTPRFAASHLGLFCLPMSHIKDASLIWVKRQGDQELFGMQSDFVGHKIIGSRPVSFWFIRFVALQSR